MSAYKRKLQLWIENVHTYLAGYCRTLWEELSQVRRRSSWTNTVVSLSCRWGAFILLLEVFKFICITQQQPQHICISEAKWGLNSESMCMIDMGSDFGQLHMTHSAMVLVSWINMTTSTMSAPVAIHSVFLKSPAKHPLIKKHNFQDCALNLVLAIWHLSKSGPHCNCSLQMVIKS